MWDRRLISGAREESEREDIYGEKKDENKKAAKLASKKITIKMTAEGKSKLRSWVIKYGDVKMMEKARKWLRKRARKKEKKVKNKSQNKW